MFKFIDKTNYSVLTIHPRLDLNLIQINDSNRRKDCARMTLMPGIVLYSFGLPDKYSGF